MKSFTDPLEFAQASETYHSLRAGYEDDMHLARELAPARQVPGAIVFVLPDMAWARRASGVFANEVARAHGTSAIAIVSSKASGDYLVSLRVPSGTSVGADDFARRFPSGGGRKTAAGINHLPKSDFDSFVDDFERSFRS